MHRRTFLRAAGAGSLVVLGGGLTVAALRRTEVGTSETTGPTTAPETPTELTADQPTSAPDTVEPDVAGGVPTRGDRRAAAPDISVPLLCRETWGARPPVRGYDEHTIRRLTVHHTALGSAGWGPDRIRRYQAMHQDRGMADLAYHVLVSPAGDAYEGRPFTVAGETFTDYDPAGHLHVVLEGNFDEERPSDAQLGTLAGLLAWGARTYGVSPGTISGHQRFTATACPGRALQRVIASGELRAEVERILGAGGAELAPTC